MLYRSINIAMILLLSWFAYTATQSSQQLSFQLMNLHQRMADQAELAVAAQRETHQQIGEITAFIGRQQQLAKQKQAVEAKLSQQQKLTRLYVTYSTVLKAESLRLKKKPTDAAKLLKSSKKGIWKAGDTYPDQQKALRGLMPNIDRLVAAWSAGDGQASAVAIYSVLDKVIKVKGK